MVKSRNFHVLIALFGLLLVSQCNGMCVARVAYKSSGKILKYGIPIAVVAVIAYNVYHYFFTIKRIDDNVQDAKRGINDLKRKADHLQKGVDTANKKLVTIDDAIAVLQGEVRESKELLEKLCASLEEFKQKTGEDFEVTRSAIASAILILQKSLDEKEANLSLLIKQAEASAKKDTQLLSDQMQCFESRQKVFILKECASMDDKYREMFALLKNQHRENTKDNQRIKAIIEAEVQENRYSRAKIDKMEKGMGKMEKEMRQMNELLAEVLKKFET